MSEDQRHQVEKIRHELGVLFDRLAKAVVAGLVRSEQGDHSEKPRSLHSAEDRDKPRP